MRHPSLFLVYLSLALLGLLAPSCGGENGPIDGAKAYSHVEKIVSFAARPAGSAKLKETAAYLKSQIEGLELPYREQVWEEPVEVYGKATTIEFRNVWTEIPGDDPKAGPILLLAAHYDTKLASGHPEASHNMEFVGAIDGGGASGLLLELARVLRDRKNSMNIWIVWFDGEECFEWDWVDEKSLFGSRHFARTMNADKTLFPKGLSARMRAMVLLDLIGSRNIKIDRDTLSHSELLKIFEDTADEMGEKSRMFRWESPMTDDHKPFRNYGVKVIDLIDFRFRIPGDQPRSLPRGGTEPAPPEGLYTAWWHTSKDNLDQLEADSLAFVGNLVWRALPRIEQQFYGSK